MRYLAALALAGLWLAGCAAAPASWTGSPQPREAWIPEVPPKAQLIAVHGFNDHKGAFREFADAAAAEGLLVRAYDQPGFGEADGRPFWAGIDRLVATLDNEIAIARSEHPSLPLFVLGESMGAAVATVALSRPDAPAVDGVILSAPAVWGGKTFNPIYRAALDAVATIFPGLTLTGRGLNIQASDNIEVLRAMARDPLLIKRTRADSVLGLVGLMDEARVAAPDLLVPTLILSGAHDEIVPPAAQLSFAGTVGAPACTLVVYPEGWHLLLRDMERRVVWSDVLTWITDRRVASDLSRPCDDRHPPTNRAAMEASPRLLPVVAGSRPAAEPPGGLPG